MKRVRESGKKRDLREMQEFRMIARSMGVGVGKSGSSHLGRREGLDAEWIHNGWSEERGTMERRVKLGKRSKGISEEVEQGKMELRGA